MPVWLMIIGGLFLVGLLVAFVMTEWQRGRGTARDRRGGYVDPAERRRTASPGDGPDLTGAGGGL